MFEEGANSAEAWRNIRALRSNPPASTPMNDSRKKLFNSSLEQAQQQFEAASRVGFESRALNLYYGLSLAGRAISASKTPKGANRSPEVNGHGLHIPDLQSAKAPGLFQIQVKAQGGDNTSYGRLASLLQSDPLTSPVSLNSIWHMLPDLCLDYPLGTFAEPRWTHKPYKNAEENCFTFQATEQEILDNELILRNLYPDLVESKLIKFGEGSHSVNDEGSRTDEALFSYDGRSPVRPYLSGTVLMPAVNQEQNSKALEPILAWWVLLYSLSMITRYQPVVWTEMIDVNRSALAVPIETALSKALDSVPSLIYATLTNN
jgi:hypothetical protein